MFKRLEQGVRWVLRQERLDAEITREVDFHLTQEVARRVAGGMSPTEARRTALRDFGGVDRIHEEVRDVRGMTFWDSFVQDVRFGWRTLRRSPGYTAAAVAILGLGIGANTAIFSVIDGVLLKPLPFRQAQDLMLIQESAPASSVAATNVSIPELYDYRARLRTVSDLVEYHSMSFVLLNQGEPDNVNTGVVSANFFDMLGIKPMLGRTFVPHDDDPGADAVLVLSHAYWQQKFGGDATVVGRVLRMNNRPHTIVGVLPDFPQYPRENDVYMSTSACPFRAQAETRVHENHRAFAGLRVFGRLAAGATPEQASSEVASVAPTFGVAYARDYARLKGFTAAVQPLRDQLVQGARPMLLALGGATVLVLLIACANVANLAIARSARRSREFAVRAALGAGRGRLLRQLVTESVIVATAGGVLGLWFAWMTNDMLVGFIGRFTTRTGQITIDGGVLAFTLIVSITTGVLFGAAPALARRRNLALAVRSGGAQGGEAAGRHRLRSGLVVAQVAVSFVLLIGAALLLQSVHRLAIVPLGYETRHVITANIGGNFTHLDTAAKSIQFQADVLARLRVLPSVRAAAVTSSVPLSNIQPGNQTLHLSTHMADETRALQADPNIASDGYFETLNVPLLAGRTFRESDGPEAPLVAVINSSMAKFWNGTNPVGSRFLPDGQSPAGRAEPAWITVVGVVQDFHLYGGDQDVEPQYYLTYRQGGFAGGQILVRTDGDPHNLVPAIKAAVHAVDAESPVAQVETLEDLKQGRLASPGLTATLLSIFAAVALCITLAGLAGVIGTSVSQRTREFGLRIALGASRASVLRLVTREGATLVVAGLALGALGAYFFSHLIATYLFATTVTDVGAYASVALVFLVAALAATVAPARRATTIDPLTALRTD